METVWAAKEVPTFDLLARSPACWLRSPKSWSCRLKGRLRELLRHRQPQAQIRAWRPAPSVGDHTYNLERLPTRLQTRTEPSPLRFSTWRTRPACAFPRPSARRAPRPPIWWLAGSLCVPPLPTWQEQVKGDAGRGPAAGRASRSSFSTSHLTPARHSAHVLTAVCAPHDPLAGAVRQPLHVRRSPRRLSISILRATLRTAAWSKRGPSCAERGLARGSERGSQGGAPGAGRAM